MNERFKAYLKSCIGSLDGWQRLLAHTEVSLQPAAGAHGEFLGTLIMRAYHKLNDELEKRTELIVPDSAHGTILRVELWEGLMLWLFLLMKMVVLILKR